MSGSFLGRKLKNISIYDLLSRAVREAFNSFANANQPAGLYKSLLSLLPSSVATGNFWTTGCNWISGLNAACCSAAFVVKGSVTGNVTGSVDGFGSDILTDSDGGVLPARPPFLFKSVT